MATLALSTHLGAVGSGFCCSLLASAMSGLELEAASWSQIPWPASCQFLSLLSRALFLLSSLDTSIFTYVWRFSLSSAIFLTIPFGKGFFLLSIIFLVTIPFGKGFLLFLIFLSSSFFLPSSLLERDFLSSSSTLGTLGFFV